MFWSYNFFCQGLNRRPRSRPRRMSTSRLWSRISSSSRRTSTTWRTCTGSTPCTASSSPPSPPRTGGRNRYGEKRWMKNFIRTITGSLGSKEDHPDTSKHSSKNVTMTLERRTFYLQAVLKLDPDETLDGDNALYFKQPSELLELFNKLESENLSLIQACQQVYR